MEDIHIHKATREDLPAILDLQKKAFFEIAQQMNDFEIQPLKQSIEGVTTEFEAGIFLKYLSEDGQIIGSVRANYWKDNSCYVGKLIVDPDFQNKGIGKRLMYAIEKYFPECRKFCLFTSTETPNTIHLYQEVGYVITSRKDTYGVDSFIMEKNIDSIHKMNSLNDFITPPNHVKFLAKKLFGKSGEIQDGAIAYLEPGGGGPTTPHTHTHNHLFTVVSGEARVQLEDKEVIIHENESFLVDGKIPHSVWNNSKEKTTVMLGITVI